MFNVTSIDLSHYTLTFNVLHLATYTQLLHRWRCPDSINMNSIAIMLIFITEWFSALSCQNVEKYCHIHNCHPPVEINNCFNASSRTSNRAAMKQDQLMWHLKPVLMATSHSCNHSTEAQPITATTLQHRHHKLMSDWRGIWSQPSAWRRGQRQCLAYTDVV